MLEALQLFSFSSVLLDFVFYYPLFMAYIWMIGGVYYYFHWERKEGAPDDPPKLDVVPSVSILIPCFDEEDNVHDTVTWALAQEYPDFEVIAINDGSTDRTGEILDEMQAANPGLRVIHHAENQGKAVGLRMGAVASRGEILVCIDGDALLDPHATTWIARHFVRGPRVGAVTGNPRIRTRSTLLGKVQVGEFSAIIGLIKRTQRIYGRVFTVSGVVTGIRKTALHRIGYWSTDMITEDIDVSWALQRDHWDVRYEPNALCWILMPETLKGLWRQRIRWAQGGVEVLLKYGSSLLSWRRRRMWGVPVEHTLSLVWAFLMAATVVLWALGFVVDLPEAIRVSSLLPEWYGVLLGFTCLLQFAVSLGIDGRYEKGLGRYYYWMIWYPIAFWMISVLTTVFAVPKALLRRRRGRAVWVSPDRGLKPT
ncbi:MAG: poly-beta-1,6-N-acetyl-D-glucosamine synthase [Gemmatimonadota bacterium]|nr:poly-beta-1,6-N-acetyl-D-glucosamine synthase [Gemmatimonadota bacterium]